MALVNDGNERQKSRAVRIMGKLATTSEMYRDTLSGEDAVRPLVNLLKTGNDEQKTVSVLALEKLANSASECSKITDAIPSFINMLERGSEAQQTSGLRLLEAFVSNDAAVGVALGRQEAIPPLLRLIQAGNEEQKTRALLILCGLTSVIESCTEIARVGSVPVLVDVLRGGTEEQKGYAGCVLERILTSDESCNDVRDGTIPHLAALVTTGTDSLKIFGLRTLAKLACVDTSRQEIV